MSQLSGSGASIRIGDGKPLPVESWGPSLLPGVRKWYDLSIMVDEYSTHMLPANPESVESTLRRKPMTEHEWLVSDDPRRMLGVITGQKEPREFDNGDRMERDPLISDRKLRLFGLHLWWEWQNRDGGKLDNADATFEESLLWIDDQSTCISHSWNLQGLSPSDFASSAIGAYTKAGITPVRFQTAAGMSGNRRRVPVEFAADLLREIGSNPFRPVVLPLGPPPPKKVYRCSECKQSGRYCRICYGTTKKEAACKKCLDTLVIWTGMDGMKYVPCVHCPKPGACSWLTWNSGKIVQIAEEIYQRQTFEEMSILADALEDAGCEDEAILSHCRVNSTHVRGCWVLDLLTGRK